MHSSICRSIAAIAALIGSVAVREAWGQEVRADRQMMAALQALETHVPQPLAMALPRKDFSTEVPHAAFDSARRHVAVVEGEPTRKCGPGQAFPLVCQYRDVASVAYVKSIRQSGDSAWVWIITSFNVPGSDRINVIHHAVTVVRNGDDWRAVHVALGAHGNVRNGPRLPAPVIDPADTAATRRKAPFAPVAAPVKPPPSP